MITRAFFSLLAVAFGVSLAACDNVDRGDEQGDLVIVQNDRLVTRENALPDPSIDWEDYSQEALNRGDCDLSFFIAFHARWWDAYAVDWMTSLANGAECGPAITPIHRSILEVAQLRRANETAFETSRRRVPFADMTVPMMRLTQDPGIPTIEVVLGPNVGAATRRDEQIWIERCENPMGLYGPRPYSARQTIAHSFGAPDILIGEWEDRITECRGLINALAESYRAISQEIISSEDLSIIETHTLNLVSILSEFE